MIRKNYLYLLFAIFLTSCGSQGVERSKPIEAVKAEEKVGLSNQNLDYATKLELVEKVPSPQLCSAVLPLQSLAEIFLLTDDRKKISMYLGFMPEYSDTDVVKIISKEVGNRISEANKQCVSQSGSEYRKAFSSCLEKEKPKIIKDMSKQLGSKVFNSKTVEKFDKQNPLWFADRSLKEKCEKEVKYELGHCEPLPFGGALIGSSTIIGDCGCNAKSVETVCGNDFASKSNIRKIINSNAIRKKRAADKRAAEEKRRERQQFLQNFSQGISTSLHCTATQGLPGSVYISCF